MAGASKVTMAIRFTAFLLTFCIGLPMCWCCLGEAPQEEIAACCTMANEQECQAHETTDGRAGHENGCACCGHRKDPRDISKRLLFSAGLGLAPHWLPAGWQDGLPSIHPGCTAAGLGFFCQERGPPAAQPRLFLRHQALLL
jgi:hypothetical protein